MPRDLIDKHDDFNGNLTKVTLPNSVFVEYSYDNAQRLTGIKDSLNNTVTYTLNNAGDATKVEVKNSTPATTYVHDQAFDELSRLIRSIGAATPAQTATFAYDKNSNLTSYTDPKANPATTYTYDALQRLKTQTDSASGVVTLGYTGLDDLNSVKDQRNNTTSYTYNAFGDVLTESSPDRGSITYVVDKAGNVTKRTDARSVVTDYTYDALNRLLTVVYPAETALNATLSYDLSSGCGTPYKGHLCRVVDNTGTTNYQYDSLGRVTNVSETRGALTFTQSYTYDLAGNIATITMPSGRVVTYTRNANGLVSNVAAPINGSATNLASSITYLPFGPQNAMTYGNAKTFSATFDTDYNPTNRTVSGGLYNWTYTTDKNSNITQAGATTYGYDALDRVNAENPGTAASYTYDATSNRLTKVQGSTTTTTVPSTSNKISAVGGTSYTYDAAGNITAIGTNGYVWSNQGLMKEYKISGVSTATYTYNAYNQRTKKVTGGVTTHYVYGAGGLLLGEYTTAGAMVREYVYLNQAPLAQVNSGSPETVTYIHTDHLGTPRFGTNSAGTQVWAWVNDAFGLSATSGSVTVNQRMPGQYYDSESSLFYNWNRYYNPTIGRYISSDPIGLAGGLNTFGYVGQSPATGIDPSGLDDFTIGIEEPRPAAISNGVVDLREDPGHTFAYLTDDKGKVKSVVSMGPATKITDQNNRDFLMGKLPGTADFLTSPDYSAYTWHVDDENVEQCKAAFDAKRKNPGNYTPLNQCTTAATILANQCGISLPSGVSPVKYGDQDLGDRPNPFGLKQQLDKIKAPVKYPRSNSGGASK